MRMATPDLIDDRPPPCHPDGMGGIPIPAITIWQPWATLIAVRAKRFEFRRWAAPKSLLGRIAIHAGARPARKPEIQGLLLRLHSPGWRATGLDREPAIELLERILPAPGSLPLASVVCIATLGRPIRDDALRGALDLDNTANDSDRNQHTNYAWPLSEIEVLTPFIPARGSQGFWLWRRPADSQSQVLPQ